MSPAHQHERISNAPALMLRRTNLLSHSIAGLAWAIGINHQDVPIDDTYVARTYIRIGAQA